MSVAQWSDAPDVGEFGSGGKWDRNRVGGLSELVLADVLRMAVICYGRRIGRERPIYFLSRSGGNCGHSFRFQAPQLEADLGLGEGLER
jgi:hypothetical protein